MGGQRHIQRGDQGSQLVRVPVAARLAADQGQAERRHQAAEGAALV